MKKILLTSIILFIVFTNSSFPSNGKQNSYTIIEIITPAKIIYDDGIYRTKFNAFYIVDAKGNKVISSGEVFDTAAKVKLPEGSYRIYYYSSNDNLLEKEIEISKGNSLSIVLE